MTTGRPLSTLVRGAPRRGKLSRVMRKSLLWLPLAAVLAVSSAQAAEGHGASAESAELDLTKHVPGAAALEGRIIAPCCWTQTIDIHGSPASTALRQEIRTRLAKGEDARAIEQSLVDRYGAKVLATPQGSRLGKTGVLLAMAMGAAGVGAVMLLRRWQRRSGSGTQPSSRSQNTRDALDERLDAELSRLE